MNDGNGGNNYAVSYAPVTTGVITARALTVTAQTDSRNYDGTVASLVAPVVTGSTFDAVGTAATQSYNNKNAGTGKTLTASGLVMNDGNGGNNYAVSYAPVTTGVITPASITLSTSNVSKTYDNTSAASGVASVASGTLFSGDTLSGGTFAFTNVNVGAGNKVVSASGIMLNDGNGGANYSVSYANNTTSTINQLSSVAWTGGSSGNWSVASNWAGGAIPSLSNVAAVTIPGGSSVTYDTPSGATQLSNLTSSGSLTLAGGSLTVNGAMQSSVLRLNSGSTLVVNGNLASSDFDVNGSNWTSGAFTTINLTSLQAVNRIDVNLGASSSITLATTGSYLDATASGQTLTAPSVTLSAGTGIGTSSSRLKIATSNLSATTSAGPVQIINTPSSAVNLSALSTGDATSALYYSQVGQALTVAGNINSAGGSIDIDPPSSISMNPGTSISSNGGAVTVVAEGAVSLTSVNAGNGALTVASASGAVSIGDITSGGVSVTAPGGYTRHSGANTTNTSAAAPAINTAATPAINTAAIPAINTAAKQAINTAVAQATASLVTQAVTSTVQPIVGPTTDPNSTTSTSTTDNMTNADGSTTKKEPKTAKTATQVMLVGSDTVQKPTDQVVAPVKATGKQLMCRRTG